MAIEKNCVLNQLDKLNEYTGTDKQLVIDESWKTQLKQIVITYIGEDSPFLEQIDKIKFTVPHAGEPTPEYFLKYYNLAKSDASFLVFHITQYIKNNGLKSQGNFLSKLSDTWITGILFSLLIPIIIFCFWLGSWFTQNKIDAEKILLKNKIDSLSATTTSSDSTKSNIKTQSQNKYR